MVFRRSKMTSHRISGRKKAPAVKGQMLRMDSNIKKDLLNLPNLLTMVRIVVIPVVVVLLAMETPFYCLLAAAFFGLAAISDFFDGYLARRLNLVSMTGKYMDPLADKLMVMAATVQLSAMGWLEAWVPIVLLAREFAVQGLRQIASAEGMVIAAGTGGKWKTALQLIGLAGLLVHYTYPIAFAGIHVTVNFHLVGWYMLVLSIVFSLVSAGQYFWGFLNAIRERGSQEEV